ncbi:tetratricopeptide repeat protein [Streptomyces sp. NPDC048718]|uniref:tetratricopeptide repeat protein n=1 Tax=Streptomyces sp. NPDC048718 TaxID=3365587 RepID=UPI003719E377
MDAHDLDRQTRTQSGLIPPPLVSRLLELGHEREVEHRAGRGEWFCAREWARLLGGRGRREEALEVLAPYVATGWWPAALVQAELLEGWGRAAEAIALVRPYAAKGGDSLKFLGRLLARSGHADEAVTRLSAGIDDCSLARALVGICGAAGRDEEVAALLAARIPDGHRCDNPWCCRGLDPDDARGLLATIRERQGRVDEAITLLRARQFSAPGGDRDQLADLLARHDRIGELRAYAAEDDLGHGRRRLAELLEERGDVAGAVAAYRPADRSADRAHDTVEQARLLARHGRVDEAIEVLRALVDSPEGADSWIVATLCTLCADHGRAREGLAHLDAFTSCHGDDVEEEDSFPLRLRLLAACGPLDTAIEQMRAHPGAGTWTAARAVSDLLAEHGRLEEAVALLRPYVESGTEADTEAAAHLLAGHLVELGRVREAVALFQQAAPEPEPLVWTGALFT